MSAPKLPPRSSAPHLQPNADLRDRFAIAALPAIATKLLNTPKDMLDGAANRLMVDTVERMAARIAYMYADAMMAERSKGDTA